MELAVVLIISNWLRRSFFLYSALCFLPLRESPFVALFCHGSVLRHSVLFAAHFERRRKRPALLAYFKSDCVGMA